MVNERSLTVEFKRKNKKAGVRKVTNEERILNSKNRIFEAALAEFSEKGYAGSSINNITKAGIPKGLLYHIYKSKDEVYLACVERCYQEFMKVFSDENAELEDYMNRRQNFFREKREMGAVIIETMYPVSPAVDEQIAEIRRSFEEFNRQYFRNVLRGLPLRSGVSEELAMEYFSLVQMALNAGFLGGEDNAWMKHEESLPRVLDFMLYGIVEEDKR